MKGLLTLGLSILTLAGFSQISMNEGSVDIAGSKNGFTIEIPYGTGKQVDKALKKELKSWKGSFKSSKYYFVDDCKNKKMGDNTFDVYAASKENSEGGATVSVAIDLGGAFMSSSQHGDQYKLMEGILHEFAVAVAKDVIQEEVDAEESALKEKQKELSSLEDEQKKMEKENEDMKKKIEENEASIEQSKKDQEAKKEEITTQEAVVQEVIQKKEAVK